MQGEVYGIGTKAAAALTPLAALAWVQISEVSDWQGLVGTQGLAAALIAVSLLWIWKVGYPDSQKARAQERADRLERELFERNQRERQWKAHYAQQRELMDLLRADRGLPPLKRADAELLPHGPLSPGD